MNKAKEIDPTIDCHGCSALCCGAGQSPTLTDAEVAFLKQSNTPLNQKGIPQAWRRFYFKNPKGIEEGYAGFYNFLDRCGYVAEKDGWLHCSVHDDPRRPDECKWFQMGGEGCRMIRESGGIETLKQSKHAQRNLPELILKLFNRFIPN